MYTHSNARLTHSSIKHYSAHLNNHISSPPKQLQQPTPHTPQPTTLTPHPTTHTIRQTEIPTSHLQSKCCGHKQTVLTFLQNSNMLMDLLRISQIFSVFCKPMYQQVMTNCCFMSEMKAYQSYTHISS
jgi:hypothetical protein